MAKERVALTELLSTMTLGQLLPHPLSHMLELAPELTASEVRVLLLLLCLIQNIFIELIIHTTF